MRTKRGTGAKRRMLEPFDDTCVECGSKGKIVSGRVAKPRQHQAHGRLFLLCPCGAHVACHPGTAISMGRPAGSKTRRLKDPQAQNAGSRCTGCSVAPDRHHPEGHEQGPTAGIRLAGP